MHKLKTVTEPIVEMKRDIAHSTLTLLDKADAKEFYNLQKDMLLNYTTIKTFSQLQATVGNKAEWLDLNESMRQHSKLIERVDE